MESIPWVRCASGNVLYIYSTKKEITLNFRICISHFSRSSYFRNNWCSPLYSFYRTQVSLVRSMGPVLSHWVSMRGFADLTDVTLVDEDTNSIPTNNTNRTIQDNVAMPVTNPGDQFENICKWSNGQYWNQCKLPGLLHSFMILLKQTWFFVAPSGGQICN